MSLFTVFGGNGFIGSKFVDELINLGHDVFVPKRDDLTIFQKHLGVVIYSAGAGDCDEEPFNVFEANTMLLANVLKNADFTKIIYISSNRVYMNGDHSDVGNDLIINENDNRRLFNLTKLTAEELCRKSGKEHLIIRPSNVYGSAFNSKLFLPSIVRNAIEKGEVNMYVPPSYSKDYVSVEDVVRVTLKLIFKGDTGNINIFNVASGENTRADDIAKLLEIKTDCKINWFNNGDCEKFPLCDIKPIQGLIDYKP
ncbi:TPA: NAD-dependent epimerase/dehydratase family protein, partial [Vibrio parahaemolyticus]